MLIQEAFSVQDFQILGGPKWVGEDRYSIEAKPPATSHSSQIVPANIKEPLPEEERMMLQGLIADRFQLKIHWETKEVAAYALEVGSHGAKLKEAGHKDAFPVVAFGRTGAPEQPDYMEGHNASMALLAERLSKVLRRPVTDQTTLEGSFDFEFEYAADVSQPEAGRSLFGGVEQLGLKLVATKSSVRHVVIDRAEKPVE
jgi:uncharacterized protein (TIGR03435 family)